ncbi:hypothetical protein G6F57_016362 [Rhizopus arrhizus]|nr:hypothetical protein G6F57_016362 [Rhizopus arrhizus]
MITVVSSGLLTEASRNSWSRCIGVADSRSARPLALAWRSTPCWRTSTIAPTRRSGCTCCSNRCTDGSVGTGSRERAAFIAVIRGERPATLGSPSPRKKPVSAPGIMDRAVRNRHHGRNCKATTAHNPASHHSVARAAPTAASAPLYPAAFIARTPMTVLDNLANLQTFVHAADTRSFVETGRLQGISASAAGKCVARLEHALGVRLFHRSTRSITLTAEGQLFLARCRRILDERDAARTELAQPHATPRGTLRIGLPLVGDLTLPLMAEFMAAYPDIRLDLDFSDRLVDVIEEGFDAVLRVGEPSDSRMHARRLGVAVFRARRAT